MTLMTAMIKGTMHRCDANCYDAKPGGKCTCICGGKNHGKGLHRAVENSREQLERISAKFADATMHGYSTGANADAPTLQLFCEAEG